jgi:cell division protease FtsH
MDPTDSTARRWRYLLLFLALMTLVQLYLSRASEPRTVPYSELLSAIREGRVVEMEIADDKLRASVRGDGAKVEKVVATRVPTVDADELVAALDKAKVPFRGRIDQTPWWQPLLGWVLPFAVMIGIYWWIARRMSRRGGPLSFGKSKVKIYDQSRADRVTFDDVAGVEEAERELVEVVDFLRSPGKYQALGARVPKGVLIVGAPGTGKTLLARAVAGEAGVPFFSISGSDFVEMFVGVGAARVRDLFEQAKSRAPCIVFIDEIDAIGKARGGAAVFAGNDEREQTLNQLLAEMDGFDAGNGVVIMAATNQPEVLDPALVRAGRFDRRILVDRPDVKGRSAILAVHAKKLTLGTDVDLDTIARRTPGAVGADLANILNEAALAAARRGATAVGHDDIETAIDRVQLGAEQRGRVMREDEKRRIAYHESGHALVALSVEHADPVHRVSIIPRSIGALGVTLQLPTDDRYLVTRAEIVDRLCVMLGGRAAEEIACGDVSTGAQDDLERATELARQMITRFGMSEALGAQTYGRSFAPRFLDTRMASEDRNFSEHTAHAIDQELASILAQQLERARGIIRQRKAELDDLAHRLLTEETLDAEALKRFSRQV